jgi:hypothetical protein
MTRDRAREGAGAVAPPGRVTPSRPGGLFETEGMNEHAFIFGRPQLSHHGAL